MASRYFFDLTNGPARLRDHSGIDAASLEEAVAQARAVVAEMRVTGELDDLRDGWSMCIRCADGQETATIDIV